MVLFRRVLCGDNSAVITFDIPTGPPELSASSTWEPVKPTFVRPSACVSHEQLKPPPSQQHQQQQHVDTYSLSGMFCLIDLLRDLCPILERDTERDDASYYDYNYHYHFDTAATVESDSHPTDTDSDYYEEVLDECDIDDDDSGYYYEEIEVDNDDEPLPAVKIEAERTDDSRRYDLTKLLGRNLVFNKSRRRVRTDVVLRGTCLVALYYASGPMCSALTERLRLFAAGYDDASLSIVYCGASAPAKRRALGATNAEFLRSMPKHWYAVPAMAHKVKRALIQALDIDPDQPCLIVLDANTGQFLSRSDALADIANLDLESASYDSEAHDIFQGWIAKLGMKQELFGEQEVGYNTNGIKLSKYETLACSLV
jgi:hypothetical protein